MATTPHAYPPHLAPASPSSHQTSADAYSHHSHSHPPQPWSPPTSALGSDSTYISASQSTTHPAARLQSVVAEQPAYESYGAHTMDGHESEDVHDSQPLHREQKKHESSQNHHPGQGAKLHKSVDVPLQHHGNGTEDDVGLPLPAKHTSSLAFSRTQLAFLALFLAQTVAVLICIIVLYTKVQHQIMHSNSRLRTITVYLAVFVVANLFSILMAFDALRERNTVQIIGLVLFNLMMMVYGAILPAQIEEAIQDPGNARNFNASGNNCNYYVTCYALNGLYDDVQGWVITIPVVTGVCTLAACWFTWLLFKEFGWAVFKQIGADITLKRILGYFQVFSVLLKFDFFFFVAYSIQFLILVSGVSDTEEGLTVAAAPVSILVIVLAAVAVRREIHALMIVFTVFWLGALVYFIYKLVKTYQDEGGAFSVAQRSLTLFSCLSIITLIATGALALKCWQNFGKGMRDQHVWSTFVCCSGKSRPRIERQPSRMSLD